jgi:NADH-quinone oxidoreductase subunit A
VPSGFVPVVVFAGVIAAFAVISLGMPLLLAPRNSTAAKRSPYESGVEPARLPAGSRFQVKFYVVAMLFILFDIEAIFLYPWAVAFRQLGLFGLVEMIVFIGMLFVAYLFIWRKGGLDWSTPVQGPARAASSARGAAPATEEAGADAR